MPLDKATIQAFDMLLQQHIDELLPDGDEYDKEDLLCVPDVARTMQGATIRPKGGDKKLLTDVLGFKK